jgi:hypothetical protein
VGRPCWLIHPQGGREAVSRESRVDKISFTAQKITDTVRFIAEIKCRELPPDGRQSGVILEEKAGRQGIGYCTKPPIGGGGAGGQPCVYCTKLPIGGVGKIRKQDRASADEFGGGQGGGVLRNESRKSYYLYCEKGGCHDNHGCPTLHTDCTCDIQVLLRRFTKHLHQFQKHTKSHLKHKMSGQSQSQQEASGIVVSLIRLLTYPHG